MREAGRCLYCSRVTAPDGRCFRCGIADAPRLVLTFDGFRLKAEVLGLPSEDVSSESGVAPRTRDED